jgi:hypothetical protein
MASLDTVLSRQALVTGRILDALTGEPAPGPVSVSVIDRNDPERRLPVAVRVVDGGNYVISGDPRTALPQGIPVALRVRATAERYDPAEQDIDIAAADTVPSPVMRTIGEREVELLLLDAPLASRDLSLMPRPVTLTGRVVDAEDRRRGLAGASVRITAPSPRGPATADADGYFTLVDLPVAATVTVRVSAAGHTTLTEDLPLDHRTPTNRRTFALEA